MFQRLPVALAQVKDLHTSETKYSLYQAKESTGKAYLDNI